MALAKNHTKDEGTRMNNFFFCNSNSLTNKSMASSYSFVRSFFVFVFVQPLLISYTYTFFFLTRWLVLQSFIHSFHWLWLHFRTFVASARNATQLSTQHTHTHTTTTMMATGRRRKPIIHQRYCMNAICE